MLNDLLGENFLEEVSRNGMNWLGKVIAVVVILSVAAFGDVMYIRLMQSVLPSGPLLILCYIGAFTSFLGTVYLLIGKTSLFTPGKQTKFAWVVLAFELIMIGLNIVLVFHGAGGNQFLSSWTWVAPATPVVNMFFVAILFFLDEEQHERYEDKVLETRKRKMDRHYQHTLYQSQLALKHQQVKYLTSELQNAINSPESLAFIKQTAQDMNASLLTAFAGRSYNSPTMVDAGSGSGAKSLASESEVKTQASTPRPFHSPKAAAKQRRTARHARARRESRTTSDM